jgi:hypothetical protein
MKCVTIMRQENYGFYQGSWDGAQRVASVLNAMPNRGCWYRGDSSSADHAVRKRGKPLPTASLAP